MSVSELPVRSIVRRLVVGGAAWALVSCAALESSPPEPRPPACDPAEGSINAVSAPRSKVPVKMPRAATRLGKGGYVCMNFTVQTDGSVGDICVSDEQPRGIFDRASAEALAQFRFDPPREPYRSGTCMQFAVG